MEFNKWTYRIQMNSNTILIDIADVINNKIGFDATFTFDLVDITKFLIEIYGSEKEIKFYKFKYGDGYITFKRKINLSNTIFSVYETSYTSENIIKYYDHIIIKLK